MYHIASVSCIMCTLYLCFFINEKKNVSKLSGVRSSIGNRFELRLFRRVFTLEKWMAGSPKMWRWRWLLPLSCPYWKDLPNPKKWRFGRWFSFFQREWFSGSMLILMGSKDTIYIKYMTMFRHVLIDLSLKMCSVWVGISWPMMRYRSVYMVWETISTADGHAKDKNWFECSCK